MTTYQITNISEGVVSSGGEFTMTADLGDFLDAPMSPPQPYMPIRFGDNSVNLTPGTTVPVGQWAYDFSRAQADHVRHISYRPINETDAYRFLDNHLGISLRDQLGSAAGRITQMTIDVQAMALPVLRATFQLGAHDPVQPVMNCLLWLREGPLRLLDHTLSMAVDRVATLEATLLVDNRTDYSTFVFKPETAYAPEPAPDQLPEARGPETRFREWSSSLKGSQRGG